MITMIEPLCAGNALRLFLAPPVGAVCWRILKKATDTFTSVDDAEAVVAYEGDASVVVDAQFLQNDVAVFFRPFYRMADGNWQAGSTAMGTPTASFEDLSTDVLSLVRERLAASLAVEVQRGTLHVPERGIVQVYTAPPSLEQDLRFPLVTLSLVSEAPAEQGIGEDLPGNHDDDGDGLHETESWLARVQLSIVGWSLNSDERVELRKAIRRSVLANMPVFSAAGFSLITLQQQDVDALGGEYGAPVYQVINDFSCLAPVRVGTRVRSVNDIEVSAHG